MSYKDKETRKKYMREYMVRWRACNREASRAYMKKYYEEHREQLNANNRRGKKKRAGVVPEVL